MGSTFKENQLLSFISDDTRYPIVNARILGALIYLHFIVKRCKGAGEIVWIKRSMKALIGPDHHLTPDEVRCVCASFDFLEYKLGVDFHGRRLLIGIPNHFGRFFG